MRQLTKEEAIKLSETEFWLDMSKTDIAKFQFNQECLCMPFHIFHAAVEQTVGYSVFTHEFATRYEELKEAINKSGMPDFKKIFELVGDIS